MAAKVVLNLGSNKKVDIAYKNIRSPSNPGGVANKGLLNNYLGLAKNLILAANSRGKMPNYVASDVGNIGYDGAAYALVRILAYYDNEGELPSSVPITSFIVNSSKR